MCDEKTREQCPEGEEEKTNTEKEKEIEPAEEEGGESDILKKR